MAVFGRFIKLPILLIAFIVYLITAISLCPNEIDLDWPYILSNSSFANLKIDLIYILSDELCFYRLFCVNLNRAQRAVKACSILIRSIG